MKWIFKAFYFLHWGQLPCLHNFLHARQANAFFYRLAARSQLCNPKSQFLSGIDLSLLYFYTLRDPVSNWVK